VSWEKAGHAWGAQAWDWAIYQEPIADPLYDAVLTALEVRSGMTLLDVACGAGRAVERAAGRGAACTGVDASGQLLDIAAQRTPHATWLRSGMHEIPAPDGAFDVVTSFNGLQFGGHKAVAEAARVLRAGGRMGIGFWSDPGDYGPLFSAVAGLAPTPPPGTQSPMAFAEPGVAEAFLQSAGLSVEHRGTVPCASFYRSGAEAVRGFASSAPAHAAASHSGEKAVQDALAALVARHADRDSGVVRLGGVMAFVTASRR
jgi:ubiquinone/menaquinone biosynthesis C-methylase UbiE